jgi:hypothetical protein
MGALPTSWHYDTTIQCYADCLRFGELELVPENDNVEINLTSIKPVKPTSYLTGDLEFLAMVLGREGYASWWCMYCMHYKPE